MSYPNEGLEHDSQYIEGTAISDGDMMVELPTDSEYDSSLHNGSVMSVDMDMANISIDTMSVDGELADPRPPIPDNAEKSMIGEGSSRLESPEVGSSATTSKGVRKMGFDIFSNTKRNAAAVLEKTKRALEDSAGSEDERPKSHERRPQKTPKYPSAERTSGGPIGISKSAAASRSLNQQCDDGKFVKDPAKWARFTEAIKKLDAQAVFDVDDDPRKVQHSVCFKPQKMKEPYNISRYEDHIK